MVHYKKNTSSQKKANAIKIIWWLQSKFPKCFSAHNPKPLKLNILQDILNTFQESPFSKKELSHALNVYTSSEPYLKACLNHMIRIDLDGNHVGVMTDNEKLYAKQKYVESLRHLSKTQKEKRMNKPLKKTYLKKSPSPKTTPKPSLQHDLFPEK